jgi:hypothetical protein
MIIALALIAVWHSILIVAIILNNRDRQRCEYEATRQRKQ